MADNSQLFHIDTIVVAGQAIAFEDSTATLEGAARFEHAAVVSASGDDYVSRKRVPTTLHCKLQFGNAVNPDDLRKVANAQISARDSVAGRRALLPKCTFASMGTIGSGTVDVSFLVLAPIQWI